MDITESLRKLIMAGVGAVSVTAEKSQEVLEQLAKKGEEAIGQGKVLNEQLRHEVKQAIKENVTVVEQKPADKDSVLSALDRLTPQERQEVQDKLAEISQADAQKDKPNVQ